MNHYNTEFVDRRASGNSGSGISEAVIREKDDSNGSNFIPKTKSIGTAVKVAKPDSQSENDDDDGVPLNYLVAKKDFIWKWNKHFEKPKLKTFVLAEESIVTINLENPSPFQVFTEMIRLQGLLTIKIEPERYTAQNGRVFQTKKNELPAFLRITIFMAISLSPSHKRLMICRGRIRQSTNQKGDEKGTILGDIQYYAYC